MPTDDELRQLAAKMREDIPEFVRRRRRMEDFYYDEAQEKFWDITSGQLLGAKSVDGAIPKEWWPTTADSKGKLKAFKPSIAINDVETGLTVEGATWWPGKPKLIENIVCADSGIIRLRGARCFNTYVPPAWRKEDPGEEDVAEPTPWIEHVRKLFPVVEEQEHFFDFAAHMIQRPDEKVNHGLVLGGKQGIGKDTMLLPLRRGVGEHNAAEIDPDAIARPYNPYIRSVMLVINEVRPHDEDHKASGFYNQIKTLLASPPEMMAMEMKFFNPIYIRNLCHVILTTNEPLAMYIPDEDRRLFVMTSELPDPKLHDVFPENYFENLHNWLESGGAMNVVHWLDKRRYEFNPAAPPPMTSGKRLVIGSGLDVRRTLIDEVLERYSEVFDGDVIFARDLSDFVARGNLFDDRQAVAKILHAKSLHFKMDERGYDTIRPIHSTEWTNGKYRSRVAFCRKSVPRAEQYAAVEAALLKRPLLMEPL